MAISTLCSPRIHLTEVIHFLLFYSLSHFSLQIKLKKLKYCSNAFNTLTITLCITDASCFLLSSKHMDRSATYSCFLFPSFFSVEEREESNNCTYTCASEAGSAMLAADKVSTQGAGLKHFLLLANSMRVIRLAARLGCKQAEPDSPSRK